MPETPLEPPPAYTVRQIRADGGSGVLLKLEIVDAAGEVAATYEDAYADNNLTHILEAARLLAGDRDPRSETIPDDKWIIEAAIEDGDIDQPQAGMVQAFRALLDCPALNEDSQDRETGRAIDDAEDAMETLQDLLTAAKCVVSLWETGNLAQAVQVLAEAVANSEGGA
jgi:hypothetical protein